MQEVPPWETEKAKSLREKQKKEAQQTKEDVPPWQKRAKASADEAGQSEQKKSPPWLSRKAGKGRAEAQGVWRETAASGVQSSNSPNPAILSSGTKACRYFSFLLEMQGDEETTTGNDVWEKKKKPFGFTSPVQNFSFRHSLGEFHAQLIAIVAGGDQFEQRSFSLENSFYLCSFSVPQF